MRFFTRVLNFPIRAADSLAWRIRERAMRERFGRIGRDFVFDPITSHFVTPSLLRVGDDCFMNAFAHISGDVRIGDRVLIGPGVMLLSGNHLYGLRGYRPRYLRASTENPELVETLTIESDTWICAGAIVLGGVMVGTGSVLAAGAIATKDIPPYVVAVGTPARAVRRIFSDEDLMLHLEALGVDAQSSATVVTRREAADVAALPLAKTPIPATFLYQGKWVGVDTPE